MFLQHWRLTQLTTIKNEATTFIDKLENKQRELHPSNAKHYTPYDTFAAVALVNPSSIKSTLKAYGFVETSGLKTSGVLVVDYSNLENKFHNLKIIMNVNIYELRKTITHNLAALENCY